MLRALVLSPEAPYPMIGGGPLRTVSLIEYLRQRYTVDLVLFREQGSAACEVPFAADTLVLDLPRHSKALPAKLIRNASRWVRQVPPLVDRFAGHEAALAEWLKGRHYRVAVIEHFWAAPYLDTLRPHADKVVCNLYDIESVWLSRLHLPFASAARKLERKWLPRFDEVLATSSIDASHIDRPSVVYPNALPWIDLPARAEDRAIAMSGNFEFLPNVQGARWFAKKVWPQLHAAYPGFEWRLIGKHSEALGLGTPSGPVADAVEELAKVRVAVVPLLAGSGTRLKILEAWAAGTPVVSTSIGCEGLGATPGVHLLVADTPQTFRDAVIALLNYASIRRTVGMAGRRFYESRFTWKAAWDTLEQHRTLY